MRRLHSFKLAEPHLKKDCELILSLKGCRFTTEENNDFFKPLSTKFDLFGLVHEELREITKKTEKILENDDKALNFITQYYFKHSGKRICAIIGLVLAKAIHNSNENIFQVKVHPEQIIFTQAIEMLHSSCLIHDDVIDNGLIRRGQPSIHTIVGKKAAILGGDYLVASALLSCTYTNDIRLFKLASTIFENMTRGELIQANRQSSTLDEMLVEYCHKTYFKTASLLSNYCKGIGFYGKEEEKCFDFGKHLGMAFQYIDDVLDYVGNTKTLGKDQMSDLKIGVVTGPVLFAASFEKKLMEIFEKKDLQEEHLFYAQRAALEYGVETTKRLALIHLDLALKAIGFINQRSAMDALVCLAGKIYERNR